MISRIITGFFLILSIESCSKPDAIYTPVEKVNPYEIYEEGLKAFEQNDFSLRAKIF